MTGEQKIVGLWPDEPSAGGELSAAQDDTHGFAPEDWAAPPDRDHSDEAVSPPPRVGWLIAFIAVAWIGWVGWTLIGGGEALSARTIVELIGVAAAPLALLALTWLLSERGSERGVRRQLNLLRDLRREQEGLAQRLDHARDQWSQTVGELERGGVQATSSIEGSAERLGVAAQGLSDRAAVALDAATRLRGEMEAIDDRASGLGQILPRFEDGATRIDALIRGAGQAAHQHGAQLESRVAALHLAAEQAEARLVSADAVLGERAAALPGRVDELEQRAQAAATTMSQTIERQREQALSLLAELSAAIDRATEESEAGFARSSDAIRERHAHAVAEIASATQTLDDRIDTLTVAVTRADAAITEAARQAGDAAREAEAHVAQLAGSAQQRAHDVARQADAARAAIAALDADTAGALSRTQAVGAEAEHIRDAVTAVLATTDEALPLSVRRLSDHAALLREEVGRVEAALAPGEAHAEAMVRALAEALTQSGDAADRIARLQSSAQDIEARLSLLPALGDDGRVAVDQAIAAAEARVADFSARQSSAIASALQQALGNATGPQAEERFAAVGARVAAFADRAEDVVARMEERVAQLEQRIETLRQTTAAAQDDIARQNSESLSLQLEPMRAALEASGVDIATLLDHQISEREWKAYIDGEHGLFARRSARLLRQEEASALRERFERDDQFRAVASRYIHDFEAMLRRVMVGDQGGGLSATLLSSDIGKIYVALAQAIDRLR